jgi:hypothetical protein
MHLLWAALSLLLATGEVEVQSRTTGAEVFIDGKSVGSVPLAQKLTLSAGQHTIKVTKRGFAQYLDVVVVKPHKVATVDVDLLPVSGVLHLTSSAPGARVFVDGEFIGEANADAELEADLAAGKRSIRVVKGGYKDYLGSVDAVAGQVSAVHVEMAELPVGSTPFRPSPPPPPKWYDHWYVWAGGALAVVAITAAIVIPLTVGGGPSGCQDLHGDICYDLRR